MSSADVTGVVEAITIANLKTVAEQPSILSNMALQNSMFIQHMSQTNALSAQKRAEDNALSVQNAMELARLSTVKSIAEFNTIDASQARATQHVLTGNSVASEMASLLATLNSGGQGVKSLVNTPPQGTI